MHRSFLLLAIAATPVALPSPTAAQQDADTGYAKTQAMVPMRDGVKLRVVILAPRAATPLPILLQRTPYNADGATGLARRAKALGLDGYIISVRRYPRPLPLRGAVRHESPAARGISGDRREHRRLRHDRLAREKRV